MANPNETKNQGDDEKAKAAEAAAAKAKADADAKAKAAEEDAAERAKSWKPRKGAPCTAVYMTGGPVFNETPGKILEVHDDGTATVEFKTPRGKTNTLERVAMVERGGLHSRTGFGPPAS